HRVTPAWHYHLHDVADIARGWLYAAGMSRGELPESSDELSRLFGVEPPGGQERHTALADAQWVRRWHTTLMSQHRRDTRPNIAAGGRSQGTPPQRRPGRHRPHRRARRGAARPVRRRVVHAVGVR